jgi:hypothetical protein
MAGFSACKKSQKAEEQTKYKQASEASAEKSPEGEWIPLFNGNNLEGWQGYKGDDIQGWKVEDDVLVCLGKGADIGGDIITEKKYCDFELKWEWKISEGGNAGVFYHVLKGDKYNAPYETGPEYQLLDDKGYPGELKEWQLTGADYAMYVPNDKKELKPVGEWNSSRIVFDDGHVEHWLNGKKIVEFEAWSEDWKKRVEEGKWNDYPDYGKAECGYFGLQDHGHKAWFRNIKVKPL